MPYSNLTEAQTMNPEVRHLFPYVEVLVRLLLLSPATSCTAERSFSTLRRLKTLLRSTMTQRRLNVIAVCYTHHQEVLDSLSVTETASLPSCLLTRIFAVMRLVAGTRTVKLGLGINYDFNL